MPLNDPGSASLTASHGAIRLGRSLALPEYAKPFIESQESNARGSGSSEAWNRFRRNA